MNMLVAFRFSCVVLESPTANDIKAKAEQRWYIYIHGRISTECPDFRDVRYCFIPEKLLMS